MRIGASKRDKTVEELATLDRKLYPVASPPPHLRWDAQVLVPGRVRVGRRFGGRIAFLHYILVSSQAAGRYRWLILVGEKWCSEAPTYFGGDPLRGETKERWRELCEEAVVEQDPGNFLVAIQELLQVLEDREQWRRKRCYERHQPEKNLPS
jgi:hypothetical protein